MEKGSGQEFFFGGGGLGGCENGRDGILCVLFGTSNGGTLCHILKTFRCSFFGGYTIAFS